MLRIGKYYKWFVRTVSLIVVLVAWQVFGTVVPVVLSTPAQVASGFVYLLSTEAPYGIEYVSYLPALSATLWTFFMGFVLAIASGVVIAAAMARWRVV